MAAQTQGVRVSGLDGFLYSLIGEQGNGTPLTILSAFAQLGLDPWREAARLARLPRDEAARELASLIARLPRPVKLPELSRRVLDVGLATHEDGEPAARERLGSVRVHAELRQPDLPR